jgi:hypothetical protein
VVVVVVMLLLLLLPGAHATAHSLTPQRLLDERLRDVTASDVEVPVREL